MKLKCCPEITDVDARCYSTAGRPLRPNLTNRVALNPRVCSPNAASRTALTLPLYIFRRLIALFRAAKRPVLCASQSDSLNKGQQHHPSNLPTKEC